LKQWSREGRQYDVGHAGSAGFYKEPGNDTESDSRDIRRSICAGIKLVKKGGFLVTSSCTNLVSPELFLETISLAAKDARRKIKTGHFSGAGQRPSYYSGMGKYELPEIPYCTGVVINGSDWGR